MNLSNVLWVIQSNITHGGDVEKLVQFLDAQGIPSKLLKVVPFDPEPPAVEWDGPVLFYGSTTLTRNVHQAQLWRPGVFLDPVGLAYEAQRPIWGSEMLNSDSLVMTVQELLDRPYDADEYLFLRPADDSKAITGLEYRFGDLEVWRENLKQISSLNSLQLDTLLQVATPKEIATEWRMVVADSRVIAASQYRSSGRLNLSGEVPSEAIEYANRMAGLYSPCRVFVLDVCRLPDGTLRIVETNCFNSAGWYWCDFYAITHRVSEIACSMA